MESPLNDSQRRIASHRIMFDDLLSREIQESLLRASLAGSENGRHETGVIEFFCGLYLQFEEGIGRHFRGDFAGVLDKTFFKHRFGRKGLVPEVMGGATSSGEVFYTIHYSDDVLQLLWMSMRLANAVGKKPSGERRCCCGRDEPRLDGRIEEERTGAELENGGLRIGGWHGFILCGGTHWRTLAEADGV